MNSTDFGQQQHVLVTGGDGFWGRHVVRALAAHGAQDVFVPQRATYDLRQEADVARMVDDFPATLVIHLAATVGGIESKWPRDTLSFTVGRSLFRARSDRRSTP